MSVRHERGASAILIALSMIVLMGMAAIAIDVSAGKNERRLDQNGADSSVLAGALEYALGGSAQEIINDAKAYINTNVRPVSDGDWAACVDSAPLPVLSSSIPGIVGASPCISFQFDPDDQLMRVRIPNQQTPTSFGRLLGVTNLTTSAAAEARIFETSNGAYPTGVFSGTGAGDGVCLKTSSGGGGPGGLSNSCGGGAYGDFGNFNPYFYTELGGGSLCAQGNSPQQLSRAIADGLDHRLGTTSVPLGTRVNGGDCPQFPGPLNPNVVDSGGGYSPTDITNGLIKGGSWPTPYTGRLTRSNANGTFTMFSTYAVDNKPIWEYIDPAEATTAECQAALALNPNPADTNAVLAAEGVIAACLAAESDLLFVSDIANTTRLTTVPQFHEPIALPNGVDYNIRNFLPVFIQGIWTNNGNGVTCTGVQTAPSFCVHHPGMNGSITADNSGQEKIDSVSAFVLRCSQLPAPLCATIGAGGTGDSVFYELELTR